KKISTLAIETVLNLETENTNKKFQTSHNKKKTQQHSLQKLQNPLYQPTKATMLLEKPIPK
ncbi:hypothetical protein AAIH64_36950, partial [Pseudomonas aeruginosa]|uniref:hypothetical protein n=1 Tax=Pseudomonas aeruginosa TaxID=287 RepID=UPI0031B7328E